MSDISKEREKFNKRIRRIKSSLGIAITETSYRDLFSKILYPPSSYRSGELKPISDTNLTKSEYTELFNILKKSKVGEQSYYKKALEYKVDVGEKRIDEILKTDEQFYKKWKRLSNYKKFTALSEVGIQAAQREREGYYSDFGKKLIEWVDSI